METSSRAGWLWKRLLELDGSGNVVSSWMAMETSSRAGWLWKRRLELDGYGNVLSNCTVNACRYREILKTNKSIYIVTLKNSNFC